MKLFLNNTLIEAARILNSQLDKKQFIKYKVSNGIKDYNQIVTVQDLLIEDFIVNKIQKEFPNTNIISEEKSFNDFSLEKPTWVIDPIDGSMNYFRGLNFYCLSLSFWEHNEPKFASVFCPYNNEMFHASKGKGATINEKEIRVSQIENLDDAVILLSGFDSFKKQQKEKQFFNLVSSIKNMRILSSSVLDICYIAAGKCEARVFSNCKFWDLSTAKLILEEAGGYLTDWNENTSSIFSPFMIASNKHIHTSLLNLLHD
ncbi:MAG TPA: inositol monophosphatase family protein [Bacteroidia bacterium]|nr:inositol monophosphatase family protein [Bacteroidia bacterium]